MSTRYPESLERFAHETRNHQMTVLRDDGLYRHLHFRAPDSPFYWFDIVTWPGRLVVCGDAGDWMFSRTTDMFEFFEANHGDINPQYWAQKLQSGASGGTEASRRYAPEAFERELLEWARAEAEDEEIYPSLICGAVQREIFDANGWASWCEYGSYANEHEARQLLDALVEDDVLSGYEEWDLREYDWSYLWGCWAIVWGIEQYRAVAATAPEAVAA